jgi:large subunit ribosomal protein L25
MEIATIDVVRRAERGRNQVARLREQGKVPAVLYGGGGKPLELAVDEREVQRHVRQHHKVFKLAMEGKQQAIFLQNVQWDCLTDRPLHIDFLRIDLSQPLHITVELSFLGHPVGISKGSRLVKDLTDIKVVCLPENIPEMVELRIGHLDLGDQLFAKDIELPEGVTLDMPPDTSICHLPGEAELAREKAAALAAEAAAAAAAAAAVGGVAVEPESSRPQPQTPPGEE